MTLSRRDCLLGASVWAASHGLQTALAQAEQPPQAQPEIAVFTKSFQAWSLPELCEKFQKLGLTGLDLTVRPGGHIEPDQIADKLPEADRIARDQGLRIVQITSSVTDDDAYGRTLFETAGRLGLGKIKLGYYRHRGVDNLPQEMAQAQRQWRELVRLGKSNGVLPCVHIHSGSYLPSHGTMLYMMLRDFEPGQIGAYVDSLHMSVEGGVAGWQQGLGLLAPWIELCAIKNYLFTDRGRDKWGQRRWGRKNAPLADGLSPLPEFVNTLQQLGYTGPYSLHSEYLPELDIDQCYQQTAEDVAYFRTLLQV